MENTLHINIDIEERLKEYDNLKIYLKIPITTRHSADISYFKPDIHVVEGREACEKDIYGNDVCCWYVSAKFKDCDDKAWLINEISECGCIPTLMERKKKLFI